MAVLSETRTPGCAVAAAGGALAPSILLVDDEPSILRMMTMVLTRAGYRIVAAANGRDAIDIFEQDPARVDLVITDMRMPQKGGREVVSTVRRRRADLPILCISGYSGNIPDAGVLALSKPFSPRDLLATVSAAVG